MGGPTTEAPSTGGNTTEGPATTEAPTTEGPTTEAPTTEGPTTANTTGYSTVSGSVTVVAPGVNKTTIEAAAVTSLALHFGVAEDALTANAIESRRLRMDDNSRRLPGTWAI